MINRHQRYYDLAKHVAGWSKDPTTRVGSVLVGVDRRHIALGYNGFPPGIADTEERLANREVKLKLTQHAERNVLDNARFEVEGSTLYVTFFPCSECAKSIVSKKIARVVCPRPSDREPWKSDAQWTLLLFREARIDITYVPENDDEPEKLGS